jgi:hypothetical protein
MPSDLEFVTEKDLNNPEIVFKAIQQDHESLILASKSLQNDKNFILRCVGFNGFILKYAKPYFQNDKDVVRESLKSSSTGTQYASDEIKKDREIILEAVKKNGFELRHAHMDLRKDEQLMTVAVQSKPGAMRYAHPSLLKDLKFARKIAEIAPAALEFFHQDLLDDKNFVSEMISICPEILQKSKLYLNYKLNLEMIKFSNLIPPDSLLKDDAFLLDALEVRGMLLKKAFQHQQRDLKFVKVAVSNDPMVLKILDKKFLSDENLIKPAILKNPDSFQFASKKLKKSEKFQFPLVVQNPNILKFSLLKDDEKFILKCAKRNGRILEFVGNDFKSNWWIVSEACKNYPKAFQFSIKEARKDKSLEWKSKYPKWIGEVKFYEFYFFFE